MKEPHGDWAFIAAVAAVAVMAESTVRACTVRKLREATNDAVGALLCFDIGAAAVVRHEGRRRASRPATRSSIRRRCCTR